MNYKICEVCGKYKCRGYNHFKCSKISQQKHKKEKKKKAHKILDKNSVDFLSKRYLD